jgi:hypothetical protein
MVTFSLRDAQGADLGTLTTQQTTWGDGDMFYADDGRHYRFVGVGVPSPTGQPAIVVETVEIPPHWPPVG